MSGTGARHLERRSGIFGLRVRVPDDIRLLVGMVEVRRSLRTHDPFQARVQSALCAARLFEVFAIVRENQDSLTQNEIQKMIAAGVRQVLAGMLGFGAVAPQGAVQLTSPAPQIGPTLEEATKAYLDAKRRQWTAKTCVSREKRLSFLNEHLGGERLLSEITAHDVRSFRDAILRLRRHIGRSRPTSFAAKQTESLDHRIDPRTAVLIFEPVLAFFRWAKSEQGYIASNPAEGIRISVPKKSKGAKSRRPFTGEELRLLFSSPLFTGCLSRTRRFVPGDKVIKDAKYWIPILAYYGGFRLGELVQLHLSDVKLDGAIPFIEVTDADAGPIGTGDAKHVKSDAGVRKVPLHPDVIALGFSKFVAGRSRGRRSSKRLFDEVGFGADGQASTTFSKWFGRFMDAVGLNDSALVFHSFRHNAEDAFRDSLAPQYVIDRIIGHSDGSTSAGYGVGVSVDVAHDAVQKMRLKVRLPELLAQ